MPWGASSMAARRVAVLKESLRRLPDMPTMRTGSWVCVIKGPLAGSAQTEAGSRPSGTLPFAYANRLRARGGPLEDHSDRVEAQLSLVIYWRALALDADA